MRLTFMTLLAFSPAVMEREEENCLYNPIKFKYHNLLETLASG